MVKRLLLLLVFSSGLLLCHGTGIRHFSDRLLSCSSITGMTQDSDGYIWIATENGLNRFDGWTTAMYYHEKDNALSLQDNSVKTLFNDHKGNLWIGTATGLQLYSPIDNSFISVSFSNNSNPSVLSLTETTDNTLLAVTAGYGTFSIDKEKMTATHISEIDKTCGSPYIHYVYSDRDGKLWVATDGQLSVMTPEAKLESHHDIKGKVYSITEDKDKRIWIATSDDVYMSDDNMSLAAFRHSGYDIPGILGMICTADGTILINTLNNGILTPDFKHRELKPYSNDSFPKNDDIRAIFEDRNGNLWAGCLKSGLAMVSHAKNNFKFMPFTSVSSPGNLISAMITDNNGNLWISCADGYIYMIDSETQAVTPHLIGERIRAIHLHSNNRLWLGSYEGNLTEFDTDRHSCRRIKSFGNSIITGITADRHGYHYISAMGRGIIRYNHVDNTHISLDDCTKSKQTLGNNWVNHMTLMSSGNIAIAHCDGVNCYDPKQQCFVRLGLEEQIKTRVCNMVMEDRKGYIWTATNDGLFRFNPVEKLVTRFSKENGLPDNVITNIVPDSNGNIWCSTYNGICLIELPSEKITSFIAGNGIVDKEYIRGVSATRTNGGTIYLGGIKGITSFSPEFAISAPQPGKPCLTRLYINNSEASSPTKATDRSITNKPLTAADTLTLSHSCDIVTLEFSTLTYVDNENTRFKYRMLNLDKEWRSTQPGENRITYAYLHPGQYILEVRTCENGKLSPTTSIIIEVTPPWHDTTIAKICFIALVLIIILTCIYLGNRWQRRRRQEKTNEERLEYFVNMAHELRSPVTLILSPLSSLIKSETDEAKKQTLLTMHRNANRIASLMDQLIEIRKIDSGMMQLTCKPVEMITFIEGIIKMVDYQAAKRNVTMSLIHDNNTYRAMIDPCHFDKVLINLLLNALKYTPEGGEITVKVHYVNDPVQPDKSMMEIQVADTGPGIKESELEKIFDRFYQAITGTSGFGIGLHLSKQIVNLHHGTISAANRHDRQGSCFSILLPAITDAASTPLTTSHNTAATVKSRKKVLVADDDHELRQYLVNELSAHYKVVEASNGVDAYNMAINNNVDLIISDIMMPGIDGFELLKKIKSNTIANHIPVILLSSLTGYESRLKGWEKGADAILPKPFTIEELLSLSENLISGRLLLKGHFNIDSAIKEKVNPIEVKANDEHFMERVMEAINRNLHNADFTVENLAAEAGVSRVQLHRKLKSITGVAASDFIRGIRLKQAATLLKENKINISQIAYLVGFKNPNLFSISFKAFYGTSPTRYREQCNETQDNDN